MPTRKISEPDGAGWSKLYQNPCLSPDHNPPSMMVFQPGLWEHTCSACGKTQRFYVGQRYTL